MRGLLCVALLGLATPASAAPKPAIAQLPKIERFTLANTSEMSLGVRPLLRRMFRNLLIVRARPRAAGSGGRA